MTNDKQAALAVIQTINAVDGFDPTPLAVEYTCLLYTSDAADEL